mmetsp:Transcript_67054/g.106132  ORF Transcript_67054/g.106132 Transcript_67054/m.106132 type:complete len:211 (-) Transcript_67054:105-737(-)
MAKGTDGQEVNLVKLMLLGDSAVGKSSLLVRFCEDSFPDDEKFFVTIGMDFKTKTIRRNGRNLRVDVWDTAGQERFRALIPGYLRDCSAALVVYDITSRSSFESVRGWVAQANEAKAATEILLVLVGNKVDLEAERQIEKSEAEALAAELDIKLFFEASARTADQIDATFDALALALPSNVTSKCEFDDEIVLGAPRTNNQVKATKKCDC